MSTFSVRFYIHPEKARKDGLAPIYARITANGKRARVSTKRWIKPESWNSNRSMARGKSEQARSLNTFIETFRSKLWDAYQSVLAQGQAITADRVKQEFLGIDRSKRTLLGLFKEHNETMRKLIGKQYAKATWDKYEAALRLVREYLQKKYEVADIALVELDYQFILGFDRFVRTERGCGHNMTLKYIRMTKKIVLHALRCGWLSSDPFIQYKMSFKEVKRVYLTQHELDAMQHKEISNYRLRTVRDAFVFSCYTGLAYGDVSKLNPADISKGIDGMDWIVIHRKKTETASRVPLLPPAKRILEQYKDSPECQSRGTLLPIKSNQKVNEYLKEIAAICGIDKHLTFHAARHTFATTVTLTNDVPIESVGAMLGHKDVRTTQIYAKVIDKKISANMKELSKKLLNA